MNRHDSLAKLPALVITLALSLVNGAGDEAPVSVQSPASAAKEKWVIDNIKVGMTKEDVIRKVGLPLIEDDHPKIEGQSSEGKAVMYYFAPPPKVNTLERWAYGGFEVWLKNDKVTNMSIIHRDSS
jgi:hypothetical protein